MREAARRAPHPRLRIPLWDESGQAERFAGVLALAGIFAAVPYAFAGRTLVAALSAVIAAVLLGLCVASARAGSRVSLGIGTPLTITLGSLALLTVTAGTCVASAALLALSPAVAVLWGGPARVGRVFLAITLVSAAALMFAAPGEVPAGAEPWIADARAPWLIAPLAVLSYPLARSWSAAHHAWREEVVAAHAVVAASEARFKAYIENAHDVTAELDGRGRLLFITAKKEEHYALPVAELLGTNGGDYIHPDDLPTARAAFEAAAAGRATVSAPIRYRGSREGWRYLSVAVTSYRTHAGKLRFVLQARDETERVEAQQQRERRVAELEAALARSQALLSHATCPHCGEARVS